MSGAHDDNIVNCCKTEKGVQLELTSGIRKKLFENERYNKKVERTVVTGLSLCMILQMQLLMLLKI